MRRIIVFLVIGLAVWIGFWFGSSENLESQHQNIQHSTAANATGGRVAWFGSSIESAPAHQGNVQRIGGDFSFNRDAYALVSNKNAERPAVNGENVTVYVASTQSDRKLKLSPNQGREYPRIYVAPGETLRVRAEFPLSQPGTKVAVVPQDGGTVGKGLASVAHSIDQDGAIAFDFTASNNTGTHRLKMLTQLGETHLLDFWVGPEMPYRKAIP